MFKSSIFIAVLIAMVCSAASKAAVFAPVVAAAAVPAPVVTARSSQYIVRNFNGVAAAPVVAAYTAPAAVAAAAPVAAAAYTAPVAAAAYTAPAVASYASYYPYAVAPAAAAAVF